MPGFMGTWKIDYHHVTGDPLIKDVIVIGDPGPNGYPFSISHPDGTPWDFTAWPNQDGLSFSRIEGIKGVRIVFDSATDPQNMVMGPLGSQIEQWKDPKLPQPSDMGTFTGTKG